MSFDVTLDPPAVSYNRSELDLNRGDILVDQRGIDWGDGAISAYMANEQRWGSTAVSYRVPNRTVSIPLMVSTDPSGSFTAAYDALRQKVARMQLEGGWLKRDSGRGLPLYADVQNATLKFPDVWGETGEIEPNVELTLECLPDFYGDLVTLDPIAGVGDFSSLLTYQGNPAEIVGEYPARAHIVVQNSSGSDQYGLLWAFRSRFYDSAPASATIWGASEFIPSAGTVAAAEPTARDGVVLANNTGAGWTDVAVLDGSHIGSYQVWARLKAGGAGVSARAKWAIGDAANPIVNRSVAVDSGGFRLYNLGQARLDVFPVGQQAWVLTLQGEGGTLQVDEILLQPLDDVAGSLMGTYATDPAILANGRLLLRSDGALRATAGGATYKPLVDTGDLARIPVSGMEARPVEAFFKMSRGDLSAAYDSGRDPFTVTVSYRPTYLFRP